MKYMIVIFSILFINCSYFFSYSQKQTTSNKVNIEIPEVALIGLVSKSSQHLDLNRSNLNQYADFINFSGFSKNEIWINYSSIISESTHKRKVTAMLLGDLPKGVELKIKASDYQGQGKGDFGNPAGIITLSEKPSDIIVNIGSCYTGKGANNGHLLHYIFERDVTSDSYALLSEQNASVNVVYTITE